MSEVNAFKVTGTVKPSNISYHQQHEDAVAKGEHYYTDAQTGFLVFTSLYHLARGMCCENACRHCPYDFKAP